jgi:hypothetical protein
MHGQIWVLPPIQYQLSALRVKASTCFVIDTEDDDLFKPDGYLAAVAEMAPFVSHRRRAPSPSSTGTTQPSSEIEI